MPIDLNVLRTATEAAVKADLLVAWPDAFQSARDRMAVAIADAAVECGDAANSSFMDASPNIGWDEATQTFRVGTPTINPLVGGVGSRAYVSRPTGKWGVTIEGEGSNQSDLLLSTPSNTADYRIVQLVNSGDLFSLRRLTDAGAVGQTLLSFDLATSGQIIMGTGSLTYPTTVENGFGLVMKGSTADFRTMIQDGNGRVNMYWNAYDSADGAGTRLQVSSEGATRYRMDGSAGFLWYTSAAGTAGDLISWVTGMQLDLSGYFLLAEHASSPSTPSGGMAALYPKTDGNCYFMNDGGVESNVTKPLTYVNSYNSNSYGGTTEQYVAISGITAGLATVEAEMQVRLRGPGHIGNARVYITSNTKTTGSTEFRLKKNGTTVLTITVPASGLYEYTATGNVAYNDGDLLTWGIYSAVAGTIYFKVLQVDVW